MRGFQPSHEAANTARALQAAEEFVVLKGHDFTGCGKTQSNARKRQGTTLVVPIKPIESTGL
jgi:hypothetical protein